MIIVFFSFHDCGIVLSLSMNVSNASYHEYAHARDDLKTTPMHPSIQELKGAALYLKLMQHDLFDPYR